MQNQVKYLHHDFLTKFDTLKLFEDYPLEKYRRTLIDHLKKIEQTKFKMTYKVKYIAHEPKYNDKGKRTDKGVGLERIIVKSVYAYQLKRNRFILFPTAG
jgi:hypothetical protein